MEVLQKVDSDHFPVLSRVRLEQGVVADTSVSCLLASKFCLKLIDSKKFHATRSCHLSGLSSDITMDVLCDSFTQAVQSSISPGVPCKVPRSVFVPTMVGCSTCTSQAKKEQSQVLQETQAVPVASVKSSNACFTRTVNSGDLHEYSV